MALFLKSDGSPVTIAITVKATEEEINGIYPMAVSELDTLRKSNIPVLLLVIDVKRNQYFLNWVKDVTHFNHSDSLSMEPLVMIPFRYGTPEEIQVIKQEILAIN